MTVVIIALGWMALSVPLSCLAGAVLARAAAPGARPASPWSGVDLLEPFLLAE